ncbi:MAG TPA: adenylate/guanylate cyclase domain-containing protein [Clostridiales bacterium]|nr:adenylate/guanylate cyclase domain-containing protein [Clostridiales bacterium]HQP70041.1 adenylate/guanylate cyclase domain-containing protein [Clostridiales bacterium]
MKSNYFKYLLISIFLSSVSLLTLLPFFDRFENQIYDLRFKQRYFYSAEEGSLQDVVIVDIDSRSASKLGKYYEWPRSYFATAADVLSHSKAAVIAYDILFDKSNYRDQDSILSASFVNAGNVIAGYNFEYEDKENFIYADSSGCRIDNAEVIKSEADFKTEEYDIMNCGSENILNSAFTNGFLGIDSDEDGVIRQVQLIKKYQGELYPSIALTVCMKILDADNSSFELSNGESISFYSKKENRKVTIPVDENNYMLIHYKGPWRTFRTVSFYDVMENRVGKKTFRDKPVIIGSSLRGLMDLRSAPIQKHLPGVEVHANIINTIMSGDFIYKSRRSVTLFIMILAILFTGIIIFTRLNIIISTVLIVLLAFAYYKLTGTLFFRYNYILDTTRPVIALFFTFLVTYIISYYKENKAKKFIRATLGKYVPEVVSKEILKNPERFKLGGEKKEITMMFSDIRNFTSYSEKTDPKELVGFLNIYLSRMTGVIKRNQGTLDKYMGDAVICFFGAPLDVDHPYLACKAALETMEELKKLKKELSNDTFKSIDIGVGFNTDTVTVGNIGSDDLFDYTAIGDGMNLASRLEGLNKYYGTNILTSDTTYERVKDKFIFRELDELSVKGKDKAVRIYELLGYRNSAVDERILKKSELYSSALKLYKSGEFAKALEIFGRVSAEFSDKASELMKSRCETLIKDSPAEWKGVWKMDSK